MQLNHGIFPLYEARLYLTERFSGDRTADRIEEMKKRFPRMNNNELSFLNRISSLQIDLDRRFEPDELMRRYFTPLETKEAIAGDMQLTLGGMLLAASGELSVQADIEELEALYRSWSKQCLTEHFYTHSLNGFFADASEVFEGMEGFIADADRILVNTEDKWALIDAATNPFPHLEKLRPLVDAVTKEIAARAHEFEPFLKGNLEIVRSYGTDEEILGKLLRFDLGGSEIDNTVYYQSLLSVNMASFLPSSYYSVSSEMSCESDTETTCRKILIIVGVTISLLARRQLSDEKPDEHINLLKLISDPTRFNVLHDMCDKYTYGLELAEKYKTTRSAMYYHLEKLMGVGLIDLKSTDYRMLYTMNKQNVYDKMTAMRDYLLNGWKPGKKGSENEQHE